MTVARLRAEVVRALAAAGVDPRARIAVACSYGPDSLALADALVAQRGAACALVYVDHGLRPDAAAVEADAVRAFAAEAGVEARVMKVAIARRGRGLEDAARQARHEALAAAADELGADWIALGHTRSDQAETVLGRLLRGAGVVGLAGIAPVRGRLIRPLLGIGRETVLAYLAERGLEPARDAMNEDPAFLRARVRREHLPALRRENPALEATLARTAASLREVADALDWMAARVPFARAGGVVRVPLVELAAVPSAVAKRALALQAEALGAPLEARHLDALLALASSPPRGTKGRDLPRLVARREYDTLVLAWRGAAASPPAIVVPPPYVVRPWRPGDRMRPAGLGGRSRKLQDLFTDRKVPAPARRAARVVVREPDGEIVWAEHIGPAVDAGLEVSLTAPDPPVIYD